MSYQTSMNALKFTIVLLVLYIYLFLLLCDTQASNHFVYISFSFFLGGGERSADTVS